MFLLFSDALINSIYIFKFYKDYSDVKDHPRPHFIKIETIKTEKNLSQDEYFENFEGYEECNARFQELIKLLALA